MPGSSRTSPVRVWFCDYCHFGPLNVSLDTHCANCNHQRCAYCRNETIKSR
ncbi:hypothetical protein QBC40DRAFT_260217 [Triangularia verruculosa]|uniref:Uncharacterized protein n=1 Tax=Triangularia verruculosa TaxID=2587418 RepID=A0AAN6X6B4_9PEZI|nr:hypothetical protein QBC40DRAFT_260217 [Triangularia verruculosa]